MASKETIHSGSEHDDPGLHGSSTEFENCASFCQNVVCSAQTQPLTYAEPTPTASFRQTMTYLIGVFPFTLSLSVDTAILKSFVDSLSFMHFPLFFIYMY